MPVQCEINKEEPSSHFIGYRSLKKSGADVVRIFLNCQNEFQYDNIIDVVFPKQNESQKEVQPKFQGLDVLPAIRKFNRFIGCLEERAREENVPRERIFESSEQLLHFLSLVKNSRDFSYKPIAEK